MSGASLYKWRAGYGGMDASFMARMIELKGENRRRNIYAKDRSESEIIQEAMAKSGGAISEKIDGSGGRT